MQITEEQENESEKKKEVEDGAERRDERDVGSNKESGWKTRRWNEAQEENKDGKGGVFSGRVAGSEGEGN